MKKHIVLCSAAVTAFILSLNMSDSGMTAYAADGSKGSGISKGVIVAIMIGVFIVTAVCSGVITYKIKKEKRSSYNEKLPSDKEK